MLRSMTGFGAGEAETDAYQVTVEVKSVNQRFLDVDTHMPRRLDAFGDAIRRKIKEHVARGKLTVNINFMEKRSYNYTDNNRTYVNRLWKDRCCSWHVFNWFYSWNWI